MMRETEPDFTTFFRAFLKIGLLSFGGPAAQIAVMHRVLVEETRWLTEQRYLSALSFCMLLPGPEAMQLATYAGWRLRGVPGGLIAGLLFVMPGALVMLALSVIYALYGETGLLASLFLGIKAAVLIIVFQALLKVSGRALKRIDHWALAGLAFVALFFLNLPFPLIILAAGIYGFLAAPPVSADSGGSEPGRASLRRTAVTMLIGLFIWLAPLVALDLATGGGILAEIGYFFSKLAVVTFGGAYAILAYMAQDVVQQHGWLTASQMMDGLGLAETTPGPLILVTQFVGFLAAAGEGGVWLGVAATAVTLWATFVPCFLWIFAGAPWIEWLGAQRRLSGALSGITAAVVGVILNLSLWFGLHVLFGVVNRIEAGPLAVWVPELATIDWTVLGLTLLSGVMLLVVRLGLFAVLAIAAGAGWAIGTFL